MKTVHDVQAHQQAGHTKLTAVTIGHGNRRLQFFAMLHHNARGEAILPQCILNRELDKLGVQRGQTYTVGC